MHFLALALASALLTTSPAAFGHAATIDTLSVFQLAQVPSQLNERDRIAAIQRRLSELGFAVGPDDGVMGARTRSAIESFQTSEGMRVDGQPSVAVLERLEDRLARNAPLPRPAPSPAPILGAAPERAQPRRGVEGADSAARLVEELRGLIERGERQRSAEPGFLDQLQALADRYDAPWREVLLQDDFRDGDFTRNPVWTVGAGTFEVAGGLLTRHMPVTEAAPKGGGGQDLLGAILQQALQGQGQGRADPSPAISTEIRAANVFAMSLRIRASYFPGRPNELQVGMFTGRPQQNGYALAIAPDDQTQLRLLRLSDGEAKVLTQAPLPAASLRAAEVEIEWRRNADGRMAVLVDDAVILSATDRAIDRNFVLLGMTNLGGDYVLRQILVRSAP